MRSKFHATQPLARVLYDELAKRAGTRDIYRLLRIAECSVPVETALAGLERLRARLAAHPEWGSEHPQYVQQTAAEKLDDAVRGLSSYHTRPAVVKKGDTLELADKKLIFYYQNRTAHIPPESVS